MQHIIQTTLFSMFYLFSFSEMGFTQTNPSISGRWVMENEPQKIISIYLARDGFYYGKIDQPASKDNGKLVIQKLRYNTEKKLYQGTMSPPDQNITLNVSLTFVGEKRIKLEARKMFLTKTMYLIPAQ